MASQTSGETHESLGWCWVQGWEPTALCGSKHLVPAQGPQAGPQPEPLGEGARTLRTRTPDTLKVKSQPQGPQAQAGAGKSEKTLLEGSVSPC